MKTFRGNRIVVLISALVALVLLVLLIVQLSQPRPLQALAKIEFSQSQAVPGFDDSTRTVTDQVKLHEFGRIVRDNRIDVGSLSATSSNGCTGGVTTRATLFYVTGPQQKVTIYSCGSAATEGSTAKLTQLFTGWRTAQ